ncbi:glycosyltransferase family 61 protein [Pseudomonas asiatica]|uniref:glycosyltransferase family 61 protein n=1 Tax=Pseudomonas asiatica TaxID=2219225 RepID=UPI002E7B7223|nr:glycosyltransferase family 61 protein [Pseudomonas asiatica]MEE1914999.1 glycosyltransferase family 61 protein [Pseudomonas asiatica]
MAVKLPQDKKGMSVIETIDGIQNAAGAGVQIHKKVLSPASSPLKPKGPFYADESNDSRIIAWHKPHSDQFALSCYYSGDLSVSGIGHLWLGDRLLIEPELMPPYWRRLVFENPKSNPVEEAKLPIREIEETCICAVGWGFDIYGHFIIEMLPRILTALKLSKADGKNPKILLRSDSAPWLKQIIRTFVTSEGDSIIFFDPKRERVILKNGIYPTYPYFGNGFHPMTKDLMDSIPNIPSHVGGKSGHYYISRSLVPEVKGRRMCSNEPDLIEIAKNEFGVEAVSPETMSWPEQIKLFRSAKSITGLSGSALHTSIFADHDLTIGCVGLVNAVQTHISGLRQQDMAYQTAGFDLGKSYTVPTDNFRKMIDRIVNR